MRDLTNNRNLEDQLQQEPSRNFQNNLSEFATAPRAIIVHDPVSAGAFDAMASVDDPEELESKFLYRELPDTQRFAKQHSILVEELRRHVPDVLYLRDLVEQDETYHRSCSNPNLVFTRDSIITFPWIPEGYIKARMKPALRRLESSTMEVALKSFGLQEILSIPEGLFLEGGDIIPFTREGQRTLLIGYGPRTQYATLEFLTDALLPKHADEIIGIELAGWRMNLDGGLVPVAEDVVVSDRKSIMSAVCFDSRGRQRINIWEMIHDLGMHVIDTTREESIFSQSCNCVCLGNRKVIYYDLCERVNDLLRERDVETYVVPGSELVKGRGGPRCMTRPIYK